METQLNTVEEVTKSDILGLEVASWDRERSVEQLRSFILRREAAIFATNE